MTRSELEILHVEDNPADVMMMRRFLSRSDFDFELEVANDGAEALELLDDGCSSNFIFLDLNLPGVDGWDVLETIKEQEQWCAIPVVIFTTSDNPQDIDRAYEMGANSYIVKPDSKDSMRNLINIVESYWFEKSELPDRTPTREGNG